MSNLLFFVKLDFIMGECAQTGYCAINHKRDSLLHSRQRRQLDGNTFIRKERPLSFKLKSTRL